MKPLSEVAPLILFIQIQIQAVWNGWIGKCTDLASYNSTTLVMLKRCQQRSWDIRFKETEQDTETGFRYYMPENTKVLFRKEVRLYSLLNFFAEVGGYLGLLLGESLLSYIIAASKWMLIFARKFKAKCNKVDDQEVISPPAWNKPNPKDVCNLV